jgi:predicted transcriptional regulator
LGKTNAKEKFIELRAEGYSFTEVAKVLGVSKPTLIKWSRELQTEIENAKAINLDALSRKYIVAKEKRIEAFGQRLEKLLTELDKRELSEISTEKLFKIILDLSDRLKAEEVPLQLSQKVSLAEQFNVDHFKHWEV